MTEGHDVGPIQMVALRFDASARFEGRVLAELERLEGSSTIRLLDLLVLSVDAGTGEPVEIEFKDQNLGTIVGPLLGLDQRERQPKAGLGPGLDIADAYGLSPAEIRALARTVEAGTVMTFLLFEHIWARDLKKAIVEVGGSVESDGLLTRDAVESVSSEIQAIADEMDAIIRDLEQE